MPVPDKAFHKNCKIRTTTRCTLWKWIMPSHSERFAQMNIPRGTYYDRVKREKENGSGDGKYKNGGSWNEVKIEAEKLVIDMARSSVELSPRQLAFRLVGEVWYLGL